VQIENNKQQLEADLEAARATIERLEDENRRLVDGGRPWMGGRSWMGNRVIAGMGTVELRVCERARYISWLWRLSEQWAAREVKTDNKHAEVRGRKDEI
jgi:hypothetical protein